LITRKTFFVPGYFEMPIKKGESVYFSASLKSCAPLTIAKKFEQRG